MTGVRNYNEAATLAYLLYRIEIIYGNRPGVKLIILYIVLYEDGNHTKIIVRFRTEKK